MVRSAIDLDNIFDSLAPIRELSKSLVFFRTNTILSSLTAGLNYSVGYSRTFSSIYGWNGRTLSKDLIRFEGFVDFVVRFLDGFRACGIECKEGFRRLFGNDTTVVLLALAQIQAVLRIEDTNPLSSSSRASSSPACTSVTSTFFLHAFLPLRDGCLCC